MKAAILFSLCLAGCQQANVSSETPPLNQSTSPVVLDPMPRTGKEGPISKPNKSGIAIQAVENENRNFITLRLINTGKKPVMAYLSNGSMAVDCEIISVSGSVWRKEQMVMIDPAYVLPTKKDFISVPSQQSMTIEVHRIPIREKIRRGTYVATIDYDDVLANSFADRTTVKSKSHVGRTEKVKVLVETNGQGYAHAKPIL